MKHLFKLSLVALVMLTVACDPLGDTYDEIDSADNGLVLDVEYKLSGDDYDLVDKSFGNFNNEEEARELVPTVLADVYPYLGLGSSAKVTYAIYDPIRVDDDMYFELEADDYTAMGESFPNLNSRSDVFKAANHVWSEPTEGDVVTIEYDYYDGSVSTRESTLAYYGGAWYISYVPNNEDYYAMGQSFTNFDSRSTARARIQLLLNSSKYEYGEEGDIRTSVFTYTYVDGDGARHYENFLVVYQHDGSKWLAIEDVIESTLTFGYDGTVWVPDNTIKYSLGFNDYQAIGAATAALNPGGSASLLQYSNFDLTLWSSSEIFTAITDYLKAKFPDSEAGQKYLVTYDTWEPGNGTADLYVILEGGEYVEVE
ncbi:MAG: hypothetical protein RJQ14_23260 [Marinoscillum sp.]